MAFIALGGFGCRRAMVTMCRGYESYPIRWTTLAPLSRTWLTPEQYDSKRIRALSHRLLTGLLSLEHTTLNGDREHHYPGCVNVSFAYVEGESLLMALKDIALSSGSACTSASLEPSYVLRALGSSDESAHSSIRFGIGRFTTEQEIDYVLQAVKERVSFLRELSPLWELVQEGVDLNTIEWSQH
jgi:cysteine desulfurase